METSKLNQRLANEIKILISDTSSYKCLDRDIISVANVSVFGDGDYSHSLSKFVNFTGNANFSFKAKEQGGVSYTPPPLKFHGQAEIKGLTVIKVFKPIFISLV